MTKFKVGDRVKILNSLNSRHTNKKATIDEILDRNVNRYGLDIDDNWYYQESDLELITEHKILDNLEVGDKVTDGLNTLKIIDIKKIFTIENNRQVQYEFSLEELITNGFKPLTKQTTVIDGKTYILNDKLAEAIEEAEVL